MTEEEQRFWDKVFHRTHRKWNIIKNETRLDSVEYAEREANEALQKRREANARFAEGSGKQ